MIYNYYNNLVTNTLEKIYTFPRDLICSLNANTRNIFAQKNFLFAKFK